MYLAYKDKEEKVRIYREGAQMARLKDD